MRAYFCIKFYPTLKEQNIHFEWMKIVNRQVSLDYNLKWQNCAILTRTNPPFLRIPSVVFTGSLLVALKRAGMLMMRRTAYRQHGLTPVLQHSDEIFFSFKFLMFTQVLYTSLFRHRDSENKPNNIFTWFWRENDNFDIELLRWWILS